MFVCLIAGMQHREVESMNDIKLTRMAQFLRSYNTIYLISL